jgi:hypothetical protein
LSLAAGHLAGMLEPGMQVNVKCDPGHQDRALLADDVDALLISCLKK